MHLTLTRAKLKLNPHINAVVQAIQNSTMIGHTFHAKSSTVHLDLMSLYVVHMLQGA